MPDVRLIDADALCKVIEDHVTTVSVCPSADWAMGKTQFKKMCLEDIKSAPAVDAIPREKWNELKETIIEMRDSGGTATQNVVCKFLTNLMEILEGGK